MNHPTTDGAMTGTMTVSIDANLRVTGVEVHTVEPLREPARLEEAFAAAYTEALAGEVPLVTPAPSLATLRPRRLVLTVREPTQALLERHEVRVRDHLQPRNPHRREHTGLSSNRCLSVTLPVTGGRGRLQVDPGWLQQTTGTRLGAAITEAYADAYAHADAHADACADARRDS